MTKPAVPPLDATAAGSDAYVWAARLLFGEDVIVTTTLDPALAVPVEYRFQDASRSALVIAYNPGVIVPGNAPQRRRERRSTLKAMFPLVNEWWRWQREERRRRRFAARHAHHSRPVADEPSPIRPNTGVGSGPSTVLFALHWLDYGGAEKFAIQCIQRASRRYRCIVLTDKPSVNPLEALIASPAVTVIHMPTHVPHGYWDSLLQAILQTQRIDLIHIHHCLWLYEKLPLVRRISPGTTVMDSLHIIERDEEGYPRVSGMRERFISVHHVISTQLKDYLQNRFSRQEGVLLGRLTEGKQAPPVRCNLDTKPLSTVRITFVGRMERQKRPQLFVVFAKALTERIHKTHPHLTLEFSMVGEGSLLDQVKKTVEVSAPNLSIRFLPANTAVDQHFATNDLLFLPSVNEGIPLVLYEAVVNGCLPIATDVGGNRELCPDALLTPPNPWLTIREGVRAAAEHITNQAARERAWDQLKSRYQAISQSPSGLEVCDQLYQQFLR